MTFDDFVKHFTDMSICHMPKTSWFSFGKTWREESFHGSWTTGPKGSDTDLAGGCPNNKDSFIRNPQVSAFINTGTKITQNLRKKKQSTVISNFDPTNH